MNNRIYIIFFFLLIFINTAYSQAEDKLGSWYIYNGFFYLSPKVELFAETQFRMYEPVRNI